jgi:CRISPR-associated protein Cas2
MIMIVVEKVPISLRGELSRWLMEISTGVFVGKISALVRDLLWQKACDKMGDGGFIMIHPWQNEQGFLLRWAGNISRELIEMDGITMVNKPYKPTSLKKIKKTKNLIPHIDH